MHTCTTIHTSVPTRVHGVVHTTVHKYGANMRDGARGDRKVRKRGSERAKSAPRFHARHSLTRIPVEKADRFSYILMYKSCNSAHISAHKCTQCAHLYTSVCAKVVKTGGGFVAGGIWRVWPPPNTPNNMHHPALSPAFVHEMCANTHTTPNVSPQNTAQTNQAQSET